MILEQAVDDDFANVKEDCNPRERVFLDGKGGDDFGNNQKDDRNKNSIGMEGGVEPYEGEVERERENREMLPRGGWGQVGVSQFWSCFESDLEPSLILI